MTKGNIVQTISKALSPLKQLILNQHIKVEFEENQPQIILFYDEERIIQVVTNLISNAIKFCDENEGLIRISIASEKDETIIITIFNNGKGVNSDDLESIFDKFYQSNNQNIKKPIGSGLGLAISKQIIEAHQGKIWAKNQENGVNFSFTIPLNLN